MTYIATDEGWLYLCSILDVYSRRFLGWSLADHLRTELCLDALDAAAMVRGKHCFFGTVLHSDHGCQAIHRRRVQEALRAIGHRAVN